MLELILKLSENQISFLSGYFLGQCYSPDRCDRKAAIESYATLYELLDDRGRQELSRVQEQLEAMHGNEDLRMEIASDLNELIKKFNSKTDGNH